VLPNASRSSELPGPVIGTGRSLPYPNHTMSLTNISHFLFVFPRPAWGHIRPFCALATYLVCEQENIIVTFVVAPHALGKTQTEISRQFLDKPTENSKAFQRIRILSPCMSNNSVGRVEIGMKLFADAYPVVYRTLYEAKSVTCSVTGTLFDAFPAPCAVILDYYDLPQLHATIAVSGHSVPIFACMTAGAAAIIRFFGPESIGGIGDIGARIDAEVARSTGLSSDEIGHKIYTHTEGKLVQITGLPAMYDYEFFPQMIPLDRPVYYYVRGGYNLFRECDAIIVTTSYVYESLSLDALKQWLFSMQKEVHVLGPLLPAGFGTDREEGASVDIKTFLGDMLVQHGKRSVFLVSFGTINWPSVSEYVDELIDALIEKKAPFILALSSPRAKISEHQAERIKLSGLGMLTAWSPQQFILNHPATGWFVTHGGFNSVTESLGSGIPLICWPFSFDQPVAAAHVAENLKVAFELFQVRTGQGLKGPVARNKNLNKLVVVPEGTRHAVGIEIRHTIDLCRSEKGQELRSKAEKIKVKIMKAWEEEDGVAREEIRSFLHKYSVT